MFANVQAPQPPGKIQNEFVRLVGKAKAPPRDFASVFATLFAGGNPGDAIARAVLGPCVSWRSFRNVSPGLYPGQSRLGCSVGDTCQDANPAGSRYYQAVNRKVTKKNVNFTFKIIFKGRFCFVFWL